MVRNVWVGAGDYGHKQKGAGETVTLIAPVTAAAAAMGPYLLAIHFGRHKRGLSRGRDTHAPSRGTTVASTPVPLLLPCLAAVLSARSTRCCGR